MTALKAAWLDFSGAARAFSRPARLFLAAIALAWFGQGVFSVLFNLYLVQGGFQEAFVGRAVSLNALGLALMALPAGHLADRWGRRRMLLLGAASDGLSLALRSATLSPGVILGSSFIAGVGQSMIAIASAPFIAEHSTERER